MDRKCNVHARRRPACAFRRNHARRDESRAAALPAAAPSPVHSMAVPALYNKPRPSSRPHAEQGTPRRRRSYTGDMDDLARPARRRWTTPEVRSLKPEAPAPAQVPRRCLAGPPVEELRFPGCRRIRLTRDQYKDFEERLEFCDGASETVWVMAETPGGVHEGTAWRLAHLAERIALVRGAPIVSLGSVGLVVQEDDGRPARAMQADATLYLHPRRSRMPAGSLIVGEHDLPDVVLEVDYTTDVRPGKLPLYEAWGFPELWVIVPPRAKRKRRRPKGGDDPPAAERAVSFAARKRGVSRLDAAEIHAALTERVTSAGTDRVLERVGRTMGAREGTEPDDTPLLSSLGSRRAPRDSPRGAPRDSPQGAPRDSPQGAPRDSPQGTLRDSPQGTLRDSPQGAPKSLARRFGACSWRAGSGCRHRIG